LTVAVTWASFAACDDQVRISPRVFAEAWIGGWSRSQDCRQHPPDAQRPVQSFRKEAVVTSDAWAVAAQLRTDTQALANAADAAGKAPSIHHTQPWRWSLAGDELDLYVDYRRGLEVTDIEARFAVLSCGAALHRAVVSLTADGLYAVVVRLPNRAHPGHLAQVHIGHQIPVVGTVRHRQTAGPRYASRRSDLGAGIDGDTVWSITAAVQSTGTRLLLLRSAQVFELGVAADHAQRTAAGKAAWQVERGYWIGGDRPLDGSVPGAAPPATTPGHDGDPLASHAHGHAEVIAILYGSEDSTLAWLRAGEALSAAWLAAAELAVSVMPLSAMIEIASTREKMQRLLGGLGFPYLVLRFGTIEPIDTTEPHTPRPPADPTIDVRNAKG
jgi:hypothetical protein